MKTSNRKRLPQAARCASALLIAAWIPLTAFAQVELQETANQAIAVADARAVALDTEKKPAGASADKTGAGAMQPTPAAAFFQQPASPTMAASPTLARKVSKRQAQKKTPGEHADSPGATLEQPMGEASLTEGSERAVFHRTPVQIMLRVGNERILHFPHPVTLNVPDDVLPFLGQPDIIDNAVYVTAAQSFPRIRIVAQDLVTGQFIPLDLQASRDAVASHELDILVATDKAPASSPVSDNEEDSDAAPDMVMMTRYASHMLYAPRRLAKPVAGIRQVAVSTKPVPGLYRAALVEATPMGQWRSQDLYVTAVKFVNRGKMPIELDMNELRGQWISATSQHGRLAGAGSEEDTTAVYLVSERPFDEAR